MTFDNENMENKIGTLAYEKPSLKNYGTMKEMTLGVGGSLGDGMATVDTAFNDAGDDGTNLQDSPSAHDIPNIPGFDPADI